LGLMTRFWSRGVIHFLSQTNHVSQPSLLQPWWWQQNVPPNRWQTAKMLYSGTTQIIYIHSAVKASNVIYVTS
jgi:hypothetical protein